ncbi:MAG: PIN domain protein [Anaerolineae bacterium]|nr:type II toxin-antitoxin system VapC family toxin [Anaerolineales bacterium]MCQ3973087.1 PIN domain protein [Anaerolineae bacterium]
MISLVLDTHTIIWLTHGDARLSLTARQAIDAVTEQASQVAISSISLVETAYLEEKDRIPAGTLVGVLSLLDAPHPLLVEVPVTRQIIAALLNISRVTVPDMPDRVIAATALSLSVPLVSRDRKIQDSQIQTIW